MSDEFDTTDGKIAVIGMAGRFPGAQDIDALWSNLYAGKESVTHFSPEEIDATVPPDVASDKAYVRARGVIEGIEEFDAEHFRMRPLEARVMDPQQRVLLEVCWEALENAGCDPSRFDGSIGVYATASASTYLAHHLVPNREVCANAGDVAVRIGNEIDYIASNIAYRLDLDGPAVTLRTACSSSLVAVAHGCQALADYQCDIVLAGGVSITSPQATGYHHQPGGILSGDGHCRTFDASAQGTYFSNGAGVVVLKRLEDAVRAKDEILAVLIGYAVNNDGSDRVSFTAPSVRGQSDVIAMAQELAAISPETVTYIEAHGTATEVGDPIEVEGLTAAFRRGTDRKGFCGIGSIKSNFGHLDVAAGVAGLIKTVLALRHRYLPATINFSRPNPKIDFASTPFFVVSEGREWVSDLSPRRAGVSSFGTGGTNAHIVLEEGPLLEPSPASVGEQLLLLSARTPEALQEATDRLRLRLENDPELNLVDVAHTLRYGRNEFDHRRFVVCNRKQAAEVLTALPARLSGTGEIARSGRPVLMFPGQGTQYPGMGAGLYASEPVYRKEVDRCLEILQLSVGDDIRSVLFQEDGDEQSCAERLKDTAYAQPAIFLVEYSLARLWQHRGVVPDAMIGHSIGEFVAATLGGVFALEDALQMVALRGKLMMEQPPGTMLSVRTSGASLSEKLPRDLSVACINGPELCVISGPSRQIEGFMQSLEADGIACRILHTSHAFHSAMMEPAIEPFLAALKAVPLQPAQMRIMSTVTADWLSDEQCTDPVYWARHLRETVRFSDGVQRLLDEGASVFLECGARSTLSTLARQQFPRNRRVVAVPSLGEASSPEAERIANLRAVGELWANGVEIDWQAVDDVFTRGRKVALPSYPFQRRRLWVDPIAVGEDLPAARNISNERMDANVEGVEGMHIETSRVDRIVAMVMKLLSETSGTDLEDTDPTLTFLEMGFESLFLTQVSGKLGKETGVSVTFRQMLEDYPTPKELASYLDSVLPPDAFRPAPGPTSSPVLLSPVTAAQASSGRLVDMAGSDVLQRIVGEQLEVMRQQLALMSTIGNDTLRQVAPVAEPRPKQVKEAPVNAGRDNAKAFGPAARVNRSRAEPLTAEQDRFLKDLIGRYTKKTAKSKVSTERNRQALADPRTVSGFHPLWKEMVYPIVSVGSSGSRITDLDGNSYIDVTNGFGTILFGHSPDFIIEALQRQLEAGYETGPQTELAGRAASLVAELTGHERVAFTNTGSEAVLAAMRMARTCTGKDRIALFSGSYHGIFDEVLVRAAGADHGGIPAAPGIPASATGNVLVLDYGAEEALRVIESESDTLAAVLVESIQGGNASYRPVEFLRSLRELTERKGIALIFDEVVTGFRVHPAGAQGLFGIKADIASYGKVAGGGMPIGVVAGKAHFMDALDGGSWQFGDESRPEANMTFFAGTFVRHPLALAAAVAVLERLKEAGPALQEGLNERAGRFAERLNRVFIEAGVPMRYNYFSSFGRIAAEQDLPYSGLLYALLREKGIHIWEGRAVIVTLAHSEEDLDCVVSAFADSIRELQAVNLLPRPDEQTEVQGLRTSRTVSGNGGPVPGAQLGRTPEGFPAWFIADPERPGKYIQVGEALVAS